MTQALDKRIMELCTLIANEQDSGKFLNLVAALN